MNPYRRLTCKLSSPFHTITDSNHAMAAPRAACRGIKIRFRQTFVTNATQVAIITGRMCLVIVSRALCPATALITNVTHKTRRIRAPL